MPVMMKQMGANSPTTTTHVNLYSFGVYCVCCFMSLVVLPSAHAYLPSNLSGYFETVDLGSLIRNKRTIM